MVVAGAAGAPRASDVSGAAGVLDVVVCEAESATGASCFWLDASLFLNRLKKLNMVRNVAVRAPRAGDVGAGNGAPVADRTF